MPDERGNNRIALRLHSSSHQTYRQKHQSVGLAVEPHIFYSQKCRKQDCLDTLSKGKEMKKYQIVAKFDTKNVGHALKALLEAGFQSITASTINGGVLVSMHDGESARSPLSIKADLYDAGARGGIIIGGDEMVRIAES